MHEQQRAVDPEGPFAANGSGEAGNSLDQRSIGTDYNLQISNGIQNFQMWKASDEFFTEMPRSM